MPRLLAEHTNPDRDPWLAPSKRVARPSRSNDRCGSHRSCGCCESLRPHADSPCHSTSTLSNVNSPTQSCTRGPSQPPRHPPIIKVLSEKNK